MDWTDEEMKLRQNVLRILMGNFPSDTPQFIYDCADEWCKKHKITSGVKKHYEVYYRRN